MYEWNWCLRWDMMDCACRRAWYTAFRDTRCISFLDFGPPAWFGGKEGAD